MNINEEVPDFLGGLGDMLPADVLKKVNELLEQLHRKDKDHQGGTVFIYAPGSQYVDKQIIIGDKVHHALSPAPDRGGELEERIRQCISLLMEEHFEDDLLFSQQNHWQAVYRILVDKGYCKDSDFIGFDSFILRVMPKRVNRPYKRDSVRNISKTDFNKPFDRWRYDPTTSGSRIPYDRMVEVAKRFKEILDENGL